MDDLDKGQGVAATSSSFVDTHVPGIAEAGDLLDVDKLHEGGLSDNGNWLVDYDEEMDEAFYLNREGKRRREEFYNAGYRNGVTAGKNDAAQDGFNQGFKDSVMVGYKWGTIRGITSALAHVPDELKLKLVESEEKKKEFLKLYGAVDSIGTDNALKLFYDDIQQRVSAEKRTVESDVSVNYPSGTEHDLQSYFGKLELLLRDSPVVELGKNRVF